MLSLFSNSAFADLATTGYKKADPSRLAYLVAVHADLPTQANQIYTVESRMGDASGINIVFLTSAFFYGAGRQSDIFETVSEAIERQLDAYLKANVTLPID